MKYGYIREARNDEAHLEKQKEILDKLNLDSITREPYGKSLDVGFQTLLSKLQPGDELHVVEISRITRKKHKFVEVMDILNDKDVALYAGGKRVTMDFLTKLILIAEEIPGGYYKE